MKKIIAMLLVVLMAVSVFAACGNDEESSTPDFGTSKNESSAAASSEPKHESSEDKSSQAESSTDESSADDNSSESSTDESSKGGEDEPKVEYTNKFISWGKHVKQGIVDVRATDATSLRLSKINATVNKGDVGVFTSDYGKTIKADGQTYEDFAVAVFEYDKAVFSYVKKSFSDVGKAAADTAIPADGYVVVIYKTETAKIKAISALGDKTAVFPHGFCVNRGLWATIKNGTATVDGNVTEAEYGTPIWDINSNNVLCSYAQFEVNKYFASAKVYLKYDSENLYLGVVVDNPEHDCPVTSANVGSMYNYECIQVNVSSMSADSQYMKDHWDHQVDQDAAGKNIVRQYGFCVNNDGESLSTVWMGNPTTFTGKTVSKRDDAAKKTYYEASIPWSEIGEKGSPVKVQKGTEISFSVSINCGSSTSTFKNITLRDGGGIIGINDWSKLPVITLG